MANAAHVAEMVPYTTFRYRVEIDGISTGSENAYFGFSEVSSMDATIDVIEYREGWMAPTPKKFPGMVKYGNLTLKRGLTTSTALYSWITDELTVGGYDKRKVTISLVDPQGNPLYTWTIKNAWVTKYTTPDFKASSGELAFESIELAHEGFTQESKGEGSNDYVKNSGSGMPGSTAPEEGAAG